MLRDRVVRAVQNLLGPRATTIVLALVGPHGARIVREFLGRKTRHHVRAGQRAVTIGEGTATWAFCPDTLTPGAVVYSVGIGTDILLDRELIKRYGVEVFAFDPTPESVRWLKTQALPPGFHAFEYGVAAFDGVAIFEQIEGAIFAISGTSAGAKCTEPLKVRQLATIMRDLGHVRLALLKLDIEGGEYDVIPNMLNSGIEPDQILVEFHHRFSAYSIADTERMVQALKEHGYEILAISDTGREFAFHHPAEPMGSLSPKNDGRQE
jgi:FkbM family methyltransferase